jgi:hypothetical protein
VKTKKDETLQGSIQIDKVIEAELVDEFSPSS